jgi:hypothetical protein
MTDVLQRIQSEGGQIIMVKRLLRLRSVTWPFTLILKVTG